MVIKRATYESFTMMRKKTHPDITLVNLVIILINSVNTEKDMDFQSWDRAHTVEGTHWAGMVTLIMRQDTDFVNSAENTKDMVIKRVTEAESIKMGNNRMNKLVHGRKHTFEVNITI